MPPSCVLYGLHVCKRMAKVHRMQIIRMLHPRHDHGYQTVL